MTVMRIMIMTKAMTKVMIKGDDVVKWRRVSLEIMIDYEYYDHDDYSD